VEILTDTGRSKSYPSKCV